jgi:hypothetical protein
LFHADLPISDNREDHMSRATIDYMNARREAKAASGGTTYSREAKQAPDRDLPIEEQTAQQIESAWIDQRINSDAMWERIFARFGLAQSETEIPF